MKSVVRSTVIVRRDRILEPDILEPDILEPEMTRLVCGLATVGLLLLTASCLAVGPKTIPRDQFDYGAAIRTSSKEQILSNIVGLRYLDAPIFVDVASVINQYSLEGEVDLGAGFNTGLAGENTLLVGGSGRYADRPTITYTPVTGQKFAQSLLTPISPQNLFALVQAGWPPEFILRLTVRSINGLENEWANPSQQGPADPRFTKLLQVWSRLRRARALGLRRSQQEGSAGIVIYARDEDLDAGLVADLDFMHEALGLDPSFEEFRLGYGLVPDAPDEIVVLTSSILEIMNELAWRADVPPEHVEQGKTGPTSLAPDETLGPLIRVGYSTERPEDAYVAIRNRDHWFYIEDGDVRSKRVFAMLQVILSLTDVSDAARGPIVSITN